MAEEKKNTKAFEETKAALSDKALDEVAGGAESLEGFSGWQIAFDEASQRAADGDTQANYAVIRGDRSPWPPKK